jgi:hypothetical protein
MLNPANCRQLGLPPFGDGDGTLHAPRHANAIRHPPQNLHVRHTPSADILFRLPACASQSRSPANLMVLSFISENPLIAKLQYGLKITFIFILILFIDSVNRVYRVQVELAAATDGSKGGA